MRSTFSARIVTPQSVEEIENISFFRAEDESGTFGLLAHHTHFLTILKPSVSIAVINEKEHYYAFNGGILTFKDNLLTITAKEFVQSDRMKELKTMIKKSFEQMEEKDHMFYENMENLQKAFFRKIIELEREIG